MTIRSIYKWLDDNLERTADRIYLSLLDPREREMIQEQEVYVTNPRRGDDPRSLSHDDVTDFMTAADSREDPMWESIIAYIQGPLRTRAFWRSYALEYSLKWMRRWAHEDGLRWGKP